MLAQALARCLKHHGGTIMCNSPVERILLQDGKATGVRLQGGEIIEADVVVSGAHIQTTMLDLLGREDLSTRTRTQVESLRVGNGIGMTVRYAIDELPAYTALPRGPANTPGPEHHGMQLICPSVEYLQRAYDDAQLGHPARKPALVAMTPSAVDPSIAPEGKHSLYIWAQYHPYTLADEQNWDSIREREADRLLETLAEYAPNVAGATTHRYIQTPLDFERNTGLLRGNIMHIDMSLDQMFMFRPLPEMSQYKTPIEGLYITGASAHPGGGVSGASGRNAASALLSDLQAKRGNWQGWALAGTALAGAIALKRRQRHK